MKKYIAILSVLLIVVGCSNDKDENIIQVNPEFSYSLVNVEEDNSIQVQITNGNGPFSVESSNQDIVRVSIDGKTISIIGIAKGNAIITVVGSDKGASKIDVSVGESPNKAFKENSTLRFERTNTPTIINTEAQYLFYRDEGVLFDSEKNKLGYARRDGSTYFFIEWEGDSNIGVKSNPSIRDISGTKSINKVEIVKNDNGIIWILYKEKEDSPEDKLVQRW